ncbi:MAG: CHAT domain-containing protein [Acidimicrobiia bacterium]
MLIDRARIHPRRTLVDGNLLLNTLGSSDHRARAIVLRALSIAGRYATTIRESISYAESAVSEAEAAADLELGARARMTLAGSLALAGENARADAVLEEASATATGLLAAEIDFQRGSVLSRMGESTRALETYGAALPVFLEHDDQESVAMTLHNQALLKLNAGDIAGAELDLRRASDLYEGIGQIVPRAFVDHNLGMVAARRGDIPTALQLFDVSERELRGLLGSAAEVQVSRVEILLSAGLFREALALAVDTAGSMHEAGLGEDEAEARLVGAQASLLAGDVELALRWADIAAELFDQQRRVVWAASARLVGIQAQYQAGAINPALIVEAKEIATVLETEGQVIPAFNARLTAGRIGLELGLVTEAIEDLARVAEQRTGPVELRLQSWLATALVRQATGNTAGADAAARAGMRLLDEYQAALGATDIRTGVERHGAELGELGLRLALNSSNPRRVFAWMERSRARALRHRPVTPSDDRAQAADLAELRRVSMELRAAEGNEVRELGRQERALQESIRDRGRVARGGRSKSRAALPDIAKSLGKKTLVEFASLDDRLWAVTIRDGRFSVAGLGPEPVVLAELESLRFMMRRLARGRGNASNDLARQVAGRLDEMLFGSLDTGIGPLVVIPTPALHATPWATLPTCRGRSVTVAPSAELWWRASMRRRRSGAVVVAAGPDLALAETETREVGALYRGAVMMGPDHSTVEEIRNVLDRAATAHIASHATFETENPMFSSLRLADGDLTVYDLERMRRLPDLVVLSACDSGFSDTHAGEELMGLGSALISLGTRTLVASVGLVPDSDATRELMVGFHRGLISGLSPSEALNEAQVGIDGTSAGYVAAASFVCIGAG